MKTVVIYLGGTGPETAPVIEGEIVATIAADSGLHLADKHSAQVNLIVGDMDSVDPELLNKYETQGSHIARFDREKDETDFELAIMAAGNYVADHLLVIGGGGKRLDHLLANISVLAGPQTEKWTVDMKTENECVYICRPGQPKTVEGEIGKEVSLIPIGSDATGVTTSGLKWELENSTLENYRARGISNEFAAREADVKTSNGTVAIIF